MKIKFKNEGEKNSLADGVFEIWSWKIIVPGLMIPPRDLKIGTDGVCQTCLQRKKKKRKGYSDKKKQDQEGGRILAWRKMQKLGGGPQRGAEDRERNWGVWTHDGEKDTI